jgi:predicted ATPase
VPLFVITGGPCSGKTTLLNELALRGFRVVPESAAEVIREMQAEGKTPKDEFDELQRRIYERQFAKEKSISAVPETVFLDRALIDEHAYDAACNRQTSVELLTAMRELRYEKIFLLALLPYQEDGIRYEDELFAHALQAQLRRAYSAFGHQVIDVPVLSVEERLAFILEHLDGH